MEIPKGLKFPKGLGKCVPEKGLRRTLLLWGSALAPRGSIVTNAQFQRRRIPQDPKKNHGMPLKQLLNRDVLFLKTYFIVRRSASKISLDQVS